MSDNISKAEVLETFAELYEIFDDYPEIRKEFNKVYDKINSLQEQKPGWISVKDRLPNCNGLYLVWRPHFFGGEIGEPVVCYFDGQNTWHDSYGVDFERILNPDDVTHWMPLPEPPKEEEHAAE